MRPSIFILSWNTQTVRYNIGDGPRADFIEGLVSNIKTANCDIVAIGLQEDSMRDSPLLADENSLIPCAISNDYRLLKIVSLRGWGITTYKALVNELDYRPRGLRLAVFLRIDTDLEITDLDTQEVLCPGVQDWLTAGKGGVIVNLHTNAGTFSFLNAHLPFNSSSLLNKRHDSVLWQAKCLRKLYHAAADRGPDYLFLLGDLNFRVQVRTESGATEIAQKMFVQNGYLSELIEEADELRLLMTYTDVVPKLLEGVDNEGPLFIPTCKLWQGRQVLDPDTFNTGKVDKRVPSWCDRVLYTGDITCSFYDRWESGTMNLSDHAAVIGIYTI